VLRASHCRPGVYRHKPAARRAIGAAWIEVILLGAATRRKLCSERGTLAFHRAAGKDGFGRKAVGSAAMLAPCRPNLAMTALPPQNHCRRMTREQLDQLAAGLRQCRLGSEDSRDQDYPSHRATAHSCLRDIPLLHGTGVGMLDAIWDSRALSSRQGTGRQPLRHQGCFSTYDAVYTSVGVLHPAREAALAFSPRIESDSSMRMDASPWDSGMFYKACPSLGLDGEKERNRVFHEHTLPAPLYREYFVDYVATCFGCAEDYLQAAPYRREDPAHVMGTWPQEVLLRVFELRVYSKLPLRLDRIEAVFLRSASSLTELQRKDMLPKLRRAGVAVEYYGRGPTNSRETNATADDLRAFVMRWMSHRQRASSPIS
jgi:hypothetical protein